MSRTLTELLATLDALLQSPIASRYPNEVTIAQAEALFPGSTIHADYAIAYILQAPTARYRVVSQYSTATLTTKWQLTASADALDPWLSWLRAGSLACYVRRWQKSQPRGRRGQLPPAEHLDRERERLAALPYTMNARWLPEVCIWKRFSCGISHRPRREPVELIKDWLLLRKAYNKEVRALEHAITAEPTALRSWPELVRYYATEEDTRNTIELVVDDIR